MLDSWVNTTNKSNDKMFSDKQHTNPFYTNTPTYEPKQGNNGNNGQHHSDDPKSSYQS